MRKYHLATVALVCATSAAQATEIEAGTASVGFTVGPTVDTASLTGLFTAHADSVTVSGTTGGFETANQDPFPFSFGMFDGSFAFSKTNGESITESLSDLLTFGSITFSATEVTTVNFSDNPGSTSGSLYLLGTTSSAGSDPTPTSLTLTFNSTGESAFSASASLSNPPTAAPPPPSSPGVPEPASWAMMLIGFGAMGSALRRGRRSVSFA